MSDVTPASDPDSASGEEVKAPGVDLESASVEELEAEHHRLDAVASVVRERKIALDETIAKRHSQASARERVARMGADERRALNVALQGIETSEGVQ